jgi:hypothetical protein
MNADNPQLCASAKQCAAAVVKFVELRDWKNAEAAARRMAECAESESNAMLMKHGGLHLLRLGCFAEGFSFFAKGDRLLWDASMPEWDGRHMKDGTLFIEQRDVKHVGPPIRVARMFSLAARRVRHCIATVDKRLIPLLGRSFGNVSFIDQESVPAGLRESSQAVASYETVCSIFATDGQTISRSFAPLVPDQALTQSLRARYKGQDARPLVGISWFSSNSRKQLPDENFWLELIGSMPATFVSLQYGESGPRFCERARSQGLDVHIDPLIDQLSDLDGFAAQIAALDLVITISSTAAHLAGSLGIPTILVYDDQFYLLWPPVGSTYAWYPHMRIVRKNFRDWMDVLSDVRLQAEQILQSASQA